jgi:hypothetical protein
MGNSNLSNSEEIYVKVDQNNLIYIDPNTVINGKGQILERGVVQENLMMYVNLEADIVPRSILASDNDVNTLTSIAKGTLNIAGNANGTDFNSSWTEPYTNNPQTYTNNATKEKGDYVVSDDSGQSFGIDSINISVKGLNAIPQVQINFVDVRGKTLFDSPENSPYKAFFHIPWPIFYLTIKGFYGKAIRYRLHLVKFSTKFNETNGNFEVSTTFVGSTYAYLNDIPLQGILNAPYMFPTEATYDTLTDGTNNVVTTVKSTRGYSLLKTIYQEYKDKGLIAADFPVKTLREILKISESLDKILEKKIFNEVVDMKLFAGLKEFEENLNKFEQGIIGWGRNKLERDIVFFPNDSGYDYYYLKGVKTDYTDIVGSTTEGTLSYLLDTNKKNLENSVIFTNVLNTTRSIFTNDSQGNPTAPATIKLRTIKTLEDYVRKNPSDGDKYMVAIDAIINDIQEISASFNEQRLILEEDVELRMNDIVKNTKGGFGFEPTIRNIFAVILSNAEVLIRLMKDVHQKAFNVAETRGLLFRDFTDESTNNLLYPWPEIKDTVKGTENVIIYPGERNYIKRFNSNDTKLWPEVDFIENYINIATNKIDPLATKEGGTDQINYSFETDVDYTKIVSNDTITTILNTIPYTSKIHSDFIYELWERALNLTSLESFNEETIKEQANLEFENIQQTIKNEKSLVRLLDDNINSQQDLVNQLFKLAPYEKFQYYKDQIPTTKYIKDFYDSSFIIEQYTPSKKLEYNDSFKALSKNLRNYQSDTYRKNIFPFNSDKYLSYLNVKSFTNNLLSPKDFVSVNTKEGLVSGIIDPKFWVINNESLKSNVFQRNLHIKDTITNIFNTPYFHKQLFSDFNNGAFSNSKYVGSAYLLLNALPFVELSDYQTYTLPDFTENEVLVSSLFREVGSSQYIPYHLMIKWGSIYHRYKTKLIDGYDILGSDGDLKEGFINDNNITQNIPSSKFFDNNTDSTFTINQNETVGDVATNTQTTVNLLSYNIKTYTDPLDPNNTFEYGFRDVGITPYYSSVFHEIVNGYRLYSYNSGSSAFNQTVTDGKIVARKRNKSGSYLNYWTVYVDNTKYDSIDNTYTLLPCDGNADEKYLNATSGFKASNPLTHGGTVDTFERGQQIYNKIFWNYQERNSYINDDFSGLTFASSSEYTTTVNNLFSVDTTFKQAYDLIATFSPDILNEFEYQFLRFASERSNGSVKEKPYDNVKHYNFQDLLKELVTIDSLQNSNNTENIYDSIAGYQILKHEKITTDILSNDNLIKITIGNPKEIDLHVLNGFSDASTLNSFGYNSYNSNDFTTPNRNLIKLYVGEYPDSGINYYEKFFEINDVELNEDNIRAFRPIILIFAGWVKFKLRENPSYTPVTGDFKSYLRTEIFSKSETRRNLFLDTLIPSFGKLKIDDDGRRITLKEGYNTKPLKVELYNLFKSMNDKWIAGNSIGQSSLLEEFLFLDKANRDIGDRFYLNVNRLSQLGDEKNIRQNLYGAINILINRTGLDMKALPAYVNFYGTNYGNKTKITPSKNVAKNIFGTFLEVDYQESTPKIIIQYVSSSSKRPNYGKNENKNYKFKDDSFNIGNVNNNPLMFELPKVFKTGDLAKANKVVAFEVSVGDQNQGMFKGITLDQASIKNTSESFVVLENLARSESGSGTYNVDIGLYDYYRQASYSCEITCMGNVMIQPTMFFYLKNIPMFKGSYWITEVSHNIRNNNITTTFKGSRIPYTALPDLQDSFMSSYKTLFDRVSKRAEVRVLTSDRKTSTSDVLLTPDGQVTIDLGGNKPKGEIVLNETGFNDFGVPYNGANGERYIQKVKNENRTTTANPDGIWLRAIAVTMGSPKYQLNATSEMLIPQKLTSASSSKIGGQVYPILKWNEIKNNEGDTTQYFYSTRFDFSKASGDKIITAKTTFVNVTTGASKTVEPSYKLDTLTLAGGKREYQGPLDVLPEIENFGIGLSPKLMKDLGLQPGDVVYFNME